MPYELFLALRHLRAHQRRRLARVTAFIAVLGIAVGVGGLIVALALANGFRDEMRDKYCAALHLTVMRSDSQPMLDYQEVAARILENQWRGSCFREQPGGGAVIIGPNGSAYAVLRGIDAASQTTTRDIAQFTNFWFRAGPG